MRVDRKLPEATAKDILDMARNLSSVLKKPLNDAMIDKAAHEMQDTRQIDRVVVENAKLALRVEQDPTALLFENQNVKFIAKRDSGTWATVVKIGHETTLADYRDFIDTLIKKYGADTKFYLTSDRGDEYFNINLAKAPRKKAK